MDSVINQTLKDIEIICVDDVSTDNSPQILDEYAQRDERIIIIHQKNNGPGVARNLALTKVKSDYIMFLDPDDWFEHDACETAYNHISKNNNDMAMFGYYRYIQEKSEKKRSKISG